MFEIVYCVKESLNKARVVVMPVRGREGELLHASMAMLDARHSGIIITLSDAPLSWQHPVICKPTPGFCQCRNLGSKFCTLFFTIRPGPLHTVLLAPPVN